VYTQAKNTEKKVSDMVDQLEIGHIFVARFGKRAIVAHETNEKNALVQDLNTHRHEGCSHSIG
jgi:3-keto-L-gulonate-6-phosphate decarboxylase